MKIFYIHLKYLLAQFIQATEIEDQNFEFDYPSVIINYKEKINTLPLDKKDETLNEMNSMLKYILNNQHLDYEKILEDRMEHTFETHEQCRIFFINIWNIFYPGENWEDSTYQDPRIEVWDESRIIALPKI